MEVRLPLKEGVSVVIPVYRSEKILPLLVKELAAVLPTLGMDFEVILVNDGSPDGSWEKIVGLRAEYKWLRGVNMTRNYGQHNALLQGIRLASFEIILTMDDDLQHPPQEIHKLIEELVQGNHDVVYGYPEDDQHDSWRNISSHLVKWLLKVGLDIAGIEKSGAFRVFRTLLRDGFSEYSSSYVSVDVLLTWVTTRFAYIPVEHAPRAEGKSTYTMRKLFVHAANLITGFSTLPLRLASLLGFGFTLFGFGVFMYVIIRYLLQGSPVQGFPFLASIISIFSGVQLFAIGIFGEYLSRMYFRTMGKPQSLMRERIGFDPEN